MIIKKYILILCLISGMSCHDNEVKELKIIEDTDINLTPTQERALEEADGLEALADEMESELNRLKKENPNMEISEMEGYIAGIRESAARLRREVEDGTS